MLPHVGAAFHVDYHVEAGPKPPRTLPGEREFPTQPETLGCVGSERLMSGSCDAGTRLSLSWPRGPQVGGGGASSCGDSVYTGKGLGPVYTMDFLATEHPLCGTKLLQQSTCFS